MFTNAQTYKSKSEKANLQYYFPAFYSIQQPGQVRHTIYIVIGISYADYSNNTTGRRWGKQLWNVNL